MGPMESKLPLRYEITSTGGAGSMRMICGTVMSEGGYSNIGRTFSTEDVSVVTDLDITDGEIPVWSIRLRPNSGSSPYRNGTIKIRAIDMVTTASRDVKWRLRWNPTTLTGTFANFNTDYSIAQLCKHNTSMYDNVSGGVVIQSGFVPGNQQLIFLQSIEAIINAIGIGRTISGESGVLTLTIETLTNNAKLVSNISWVEIL
jgi:hypothetical protein